MTPIRAALTKHQKRAIRTTDGAEVLVVEMNKQLALQKVEIEGLRDNYKDLQDKFEDSQSKYHKEHLKFRILKSKEEIILFIEVLKFISSVILTGIGFYLLSINKGYGIWLVLSAFILYPILLIIQKRMSIIEEDEQKTF